MSTKNYVPPALAKATRLPLVERMNYAHRNAGTEAGRETAYEAGFLQADQEARALGHEGLEHKIDSTDTEEETDAPS